MDSFEFLIIAAAAVLFAGISKEGLGPGASFMAAAIIASITDPGHGIGLMLPLLMFMDAVSLKAY